jgi:DNA-binding MarR family transcriptional regulator
VALNISTTQTESRPLVDEVLDELTAWNPREFISAFQRWHQGSVSLVHLNVLTLLETQGPISMSHLAEALDISVASATGVVDRMEARGLVERRRDLEDRRVILVHLAEGGRQVFADIGGRRRQGLAKLLARLSDDELAGLLAGHRALRTARAELARQLAAAEASEGAEPADPAEGAGASSPAGTMNPADPAEVTEGAGASSPAGTTEPADPAEAAEGAGASSPAGTSGLAR